MESVDPDWGYSVLPWHGQGFDAHLQTHWPIIDLEMAQKDILYFAIPNIIQIYLRNSLGSSKMENVDPDWWYSVWSWHGQGFDAHLQTHWTNIDLEIGKNIFCSLQLQILFECILEML